LRDGSIQGSLLSIIAGFFCILELQPARV